MKCDLESLKAQMVSAPARALKAKLYRRVEFVALVHYNPPNWLYTSGKPQRYNPAGIHCVYFGEDIHVTRTEFEAIWQGLKASVQPATDYTAFVNLRRVLDLTDVATQQALKVDAEDLFKNWRLAKRPTLTQLIGQAVNETGLFSAIRFPSKASAAIGEAGVNLAIFRDCVHKPDSVKILGPKNEPLQKWP